MKVIEEPAFKLENSMGLDALVEREMEVLEGGFCDPICNFCITQNNNQTTTTTTTSSTTTLA
jgi:hypothetical protein